MRSILKVPIIIHMLFRDPLNSLLTQLVLPDTFAAFVLFYIMPLIVSVIVGGLLGWQRGMQGKAAGLRTYTLVTVGATLFTLAGEAFLPTPGAEAEQARIIAQIVTGIGFIGAGLIFRHGTNGEQVEGVTTAAGLWVTAALGVLAGLRLYTFAFIATFIILGILFFPDRWLLGSHALPESEPPRTTKKRSTKNTSR